MFGTLSGVLLRSKAAMTAVETFSASSILPSPVITSAFKTAFVMRASSNGTMRPSRLRIKEKVASFERLPTPLVIFAVAIWNHSTRSPHFGKQKVIHSQLLFYFFPHKEKTNQNTFLIS